jgi:hypothetical protein
MATEALAAILAGPSGSLSVAAALRRLFAYICAGEDSFAVPEAWEDAVHGLAKAASDLTEATARAGPGRARWLDAALQLLGMLAAVRPAAVAPFWGAVRGAAFPEGGSAAPAVRRCALEVLLGLASDAASRPEVRMRTRHLHPSPLCA